MRDDAAVRIVTLRRSHMKKSPFLLILLLALSVGASAADLSPARWPVKAREQAERTEAQTWMPRTMRSFKSRKGLISAVASPVAVLAGLEALRQGGNAADAAATVALTQMTRELGSVVSYAGIMTMLYYDAKTHQVTYLNAGYNSYRGETNPKTIPVGDLGPLNFGPKPKLKGALGRQTLVPGFMAGIQALHDRFGKLPFHVLFQPAIYYARHGVTISPILESFFKMREKYLSSTPEGRAFLSQAGGSFPKVGENFVQEALAHTLTEVADHGASYMYTGPWGRAFVAAVRKDGGKATMADMKAYRVLWSKPYREKLFGHTIYVSGPPSDAVYQVLTGLDIAAARHLGEHGPYWSDPVTFRDLSRIDPLVSQAPYFSSSVAQFLRARGIDESKSAQRSETFGAAVAPVLDALYVPLQRRMPHHSNSVVVIDKDGNIAVMTHTINAVVWGDTGLVVGGIPLPDSAGFQQEELARLKPGSRVPDPIACTLTFEGSQPVLATAPIGASLIPQTIATVLSIIGQHQSIGRALAAPPVLEDFAQYALPLSSRKVDVPAGGYDAKFLAKVKSLGVPVTEVSARQSLILRGTLSAAAIDPRTHVASTVEVPGVMVFAGSN
jgi:gamma-glutamyltranspeptidase/glutathione hydrolase